MVFNTDNGQVVAALACVVYDGHMIVRPILAMIRAALFDDSRSAVSSDIDSFPGDIED